MTPAEIAKLRALTDAATPGPWRTHNGNYIECGDNWVIGTLLDSPKNENAAFIAAARTAVPALLDEVERLRGALRGLVTAEAGRHLGTVAAFRKIDAAITEARRVLGERGIQ